MTYKPKSYGQMTYPGQRVQVNVKEYPANVLQTWSSACSSNLTSLPATVSLLPNLEQSTNSSAGFLKKSFKWYAVGASRWSASRQ